MQKFKIENIFKPRVTTVDLKIPYSFKFKEVNRNTISTKIKYTNLIISLLIKKFQNRICFHFFNMIKSNITLVSAYFIFICK